jgi:SAM-dependent methyltransferase
MSPEATRIIELYQRKALEWVRNRERPGELFEKSWLDRFRALLPSAGSILDIGCGSAEPIARYLIERGHQITGVDSSAALIEICRTRFPRLQWRVADMRHLAWGGNSTASSHGIVSSIFARTINGRCFRYSENTPHRKQP